MNFFLGIAGRDSSDLNYFVHSKACWTANPGVASPLGLLGHDSAAAVIRDGAVVWAAEEERFNRIKHSMGLPRLAMAAASKFVGEEPARMQACYYLNPTEAHLDKRVSAARVSGKDEWVANTRKEFLEVQRAVFALKESYSNLDFVDHHLAHAASAFYPSAFDDALIWVADGFGESGSTSIWEGDGKGVRLLSALPTSATLGVLYARVTRFLGFEALEDEYKVMGLAAYGKEDTYKKFFDSLVQYEDDGGFAIPSMMTPRGLTLDDWEHALGPHREPDGPTNERHFAIAFSLQKLVERISMRTLEHFAKKTGRKNLCLAGGVALNCAMNGHIDRSGMFDKMYVQPAAGDPGTAIGAALVGYYAQNPSAPHVRMDHVYLGPEYGEADVKAALQKYADVIEWTRPADYQGAVAKLISEGKVIGWYQGRMEFGPRALGNRSILADPRRADMKDIVNKMVKKREEFRPFAPSTTAEGADQFFELRGDRSKYEHMTVAVIANKQRAGEIPAVVHVDGTARVHVVRKDVNPNYWGLITRLGELTGVPVVLNTSFNIKGEPIVCTPEDAVRCFIGTGIDALALQGYVATKKR